MKSPFNVRYALLGFVGLGLTANLCMAQKGQGQARQERGGPLGSFGGPGGFMGFGGQNGIGATLRLLNNPAVQEDLDLAKKKINQIKKLNDAYQQDVGKGLGGFNFDDMAELSEKERIEAMTEWRDKMAAQVKKLNKKYQPKLDKLVGKAAMERIMQIQRQLAGVMALRSADMVAALGLSDDQQKQIDLVFTASQKEIQKLLPSGGFGGPGGTAGFGRPGGFGAGGFGAGGFGAGGFGAGGFGAPGGSGNFRGVGAPGGSPDGARDGKGEPGAAGTEADESKRRESFQQMRKLSDDRDAKLLAILTDEQKAKFESLKGKPFDLAKLRPPRFAGFAGPGGPGAPSDRATGRRPQK